VKKFYLLARFREFIIKKVLFVSEAVI